MLGVLGFFAVVFHLVWKRMLNGRRKEFAIPDCRPERNAGDNAQVAAGDRDLSGNPRIHAFGGRAKHDVVDMGCYESPWRRTAGPRVLVR